MEFLKSEVIGPILRRGGTAFGMYLVGVGVGEAEATQIAAGATALLGIGLDLLLSNMQRRAMKWTR